LFQQSFHPVADHPDEPVQLYPRARKPSPVSAGLKQPRFRRF